MSMRTLGVFGAVVGLAMYSSGSAQDAARLPLTVPDVEHCLNGACPKLGTPAPARYFPEIHVYADEDLPYRDTPQKRPPYYMSNLNKAIDSVADGGRIIVHKGDHEFATAFMRGTARGFTMRSADGDRYYVTLSPQDARCFVFSPWIEPRTQRTDVEAPDPTGPAARTAYATIAIEGLNFVVKAGAAGGACIQADGVNLRLRDMTITLHGAGATAINLVSGNHRLDNVELINPEMRAKAGVKIGRRADAAITRSTISGFETGVLILGRAKLISKTSFDANLVSVQLGDDSAIDSTKPLDYHSVIDNTIFDLDADEYGVRIAEKFPGTLHIERSVFGGGSQTGTGIDIPAGSEASILIGAGGAPPATLSGGSTAPAERQSSGVNAFEDLKVGISSSASVVVAGARFEGNRTAAAISLNKRSEVSFKNNGFAPDNETLFRFGTIEGGEFTASGNRYIGDKRPRAPFGAEKSSGKRPAACLVEPQPSAFDEDLRRFMLRNRICDARK